MTFLLSMFRKLLSHVFVAGYQKTLKQWANNLFILIKGTLAHVFQVFQDAGFIMFTLYNFRIDNIRCSLSVSFDEKNPSNLRVNFLQKDFATRSC